MDNGKIIEKPSFLTTGHVFIEKTYYKNLIENKPTHWKTGQLSDFFAENSAGIKILLGLLQRVVKGGQNLSSHYEPLRSISIRELKDEVKRNYR